MKSEFLNLNWKDLVKGFIVAMIGALLTTVVALLEAGTIEFTWAFWQPVVYTSVGAGIAYLLKNWLTNSKDEFIKKD